MKIMLDTNVIISALIFGGKTQKLLKFLLASEHEILISEYVNQEFYDKIKEKWPNVADDIYMYYRFMSFNFCESSPTLEDNLSLRDPKDIQVLSDALYHDVDILLTGDKDFLDSEVRKPLILSPSMMADFFGFSEILPI